MGCCSIQVRAPEYRTVAGPGSDPELRHGREDPEQCLGIWWPGAVLGRPVGYRVLRKRKVRCKACPCSFSPVHLVEQCISPACALAASFKTFLLMRCPPRLATQANVGVVLGLCALRADVGVLITSVRGGCETPTSARPPCVHRIPVSSRLSEIFASSAFFLARGRTSARTLHFAH